MPAAAMMLRGSSGGGVSIPSRYMWLKAATGFYTDAGSTPCTTTGDLIQQWNDASGNSRHATQATSARRPTFDASTLGGLANFLESSQQWFALPTLTGLNTGTSGTGIDVLVVVKAAADPPASRAGSGLWTIGADGSWDAAYPYSDGVIYDDAVMNVGQTVGNASLDLSSAFRIYGVSYCTGVGGVFTLNGSTIFTPSSGLNHAINSPAFLGKSRNALGYFSGKVAELQLFGQQLTSGERAAAIAEIQSRLGI